MDTIPSPYQLPDAPHLARTIDIEAQVEAEPDIISEILVDDKIEIDPIPKLAFRLVLRAILTEEPEDSQ